MRDIFSFWKRNYHAVNTTDAPTQVVINSIGNTQKVDTGPNDQWTNSSFNPPGRRMSLDQRIPPIIDSFFYQRKSGEKTRQPKCNK